MHKNLCVLPLFLLLSFLLSLCSYALPLPDYTMEDGNTVVGTFKVKALSEQQRKFYENWKKSDRNLLFVTKDGTYDFVIVPEGSDVTIFSRTSGGKTSLGVRAVGSYFESMVFRSSSDGNKEFDLLMTCARDSYIISDIFVLGTYPIELPTLSYNYIAEFDGNLLIVDDLGDGGGGDSSWWEKLLAWIGSFFQKLFDLLLSLFVPPDGYFGNWFNDIRQAFELKLGGMIAVIDHIKNGFSGISGSSEGLSFTIPDNFYYGGFEGFTVNLLSRVQPILAKLRSWLTGILVIIVAVRCYKRLISLTHV